MPELPITAWEGLPTLPLAETLDPELLIANGALLERSKNNSPFNQLGMAWNTYELGIATGTYATVDQAFETFHKLAEHPKLELTQATFVDARVAIAYEPLLRSRVKREPDLVSRKAMNRAYRGIGTLLDEIMESGAGGDYGKVCELIVDGALLRLRDNVWLPEPSSVREEKCQDGTSSSHDRYLLRAGAQRQKYPMGIAKSRIAKKLMQTPARASIHPDVTLVPVLQVVAGVLRQQTPELLEMAKRSGPEQDQRMAMLHYIAQLVVRDSAGGALTRMETQALGFVGNAFKGRCVSRAARERDARRAGQPLPNGLAGKLRAAGFGEAKPSDSEDYY